VPLFKLMTNIALPVVQLKDQRQSDTKVIEIPLKNSGRRRTRRR